MLPQAVAPGTKGHDTCSYGAIMALSEDTALLVYSDFNWPDAQGVKRKTILSRTLTAKKSIPKP